MSGDYTRLTFDPVRGFSGVRKQQGRVSLDSDFNEFEGILDRRDRGATYDTVGHAVFPSTTPEAFRIGIGPGGLTIGIGRAYVDGICAECFGDLTDLTSPAKTTFDAHLGNRVGKAPLPFDNQPFFYAPDFPTFTNTARTASLLYLDVWQREVTIYEDEELGEPALGGPDTATRMQTAWQVKSLLGHAGLTCATDFPAWTSLTAASTARMSSALTPVAPAPGPCVISPVGGYTGLENRLYRVEVHRAGTLGGANKAQFKWSRDNASVAASVTKIVSAPSNHSVITVGSTGRDSSMRFEVDQHLELLDDYVEYAMRETGRGGELVKILDVNHATGEVLVDKDLSAFAIDAQRHPRVRRWDSASPGEALVRDADVNVTTVLEEGITVTFQGAATDTLHAGDYWVFAARTADGTIETLVNEPPRGIHHHFMKLAVVPANSDDIKDCRVEWPPECTCDKGGCGCDACVSIESHASGELTIQAAVDQVVAAGGGTVCIGVGVFRVDGPVTIKDGVSVRVRGSGFDTVVWHPGAGPVMAVDRCTDVGIRDLTLVTERLERAADGCLQVGNSALVDLDRLNVFDDPYELVQFLGTGKSFGRPGAALALDGLVLGLSVNRCLLAGAVGVAPLAALGQRDGGYLLTADLTIRDNVVFASAIGISLGAVDEGVPVIHLDATTIAGNSVYGCVQAGMHIGGQVPFGAIQARENMIGSYGSGCVVAADHTTVASNTLLGLSSESGSLRPGAELVSLGKDRLRNVLVSDNEIARFPGNAVRLDGAFDGVTIDGNVIEACGGGVNMTVESAGDEVSVTGNRLKDIRTSPGDVLPGGVTLVRVTRGFVADNTVQQVFAGNDAIGVFGIATLGCAQVRVSRNRVEEINARVGVPFSAGIGCFETLEVLDVVDNSASAGREGGFALEIGWRDQKPPDLNDILVDTPGSRFWVSKANVVAFDRKNNRLPLSILGNFWDAAADLPAVVVLEPAAGIFANNQCHHEAGHSAIVEIMAFSLAFTSNQVRAEQEITAVQLHILEGGFAMVDDTRVPSEALTVLGNITNGAIEVNGNPLATPWSPLNIRLT